MTQEFSEQSVSLEELLPEFTAALQAAAEQYRSRFPEAPRWIITSARRTLMRQAQLMAAMSADQLVGMYCSHGRPAYVDALLKAFPLTAEAAYRILCERTEGYISRHLYGAAADIAAVSVRHPEALKTLLQQHGCTVFDETELGVACYHVSWPQAPAQIIRA